MVRLSVCMCTYNGSDFLESQLNSILDQSSCSFHELLVVDDYSSDNTWEILLTYQNNDSRIRLFRNPFNIGPIASFERVLSLSDGDIIVLSDQDDVWHRDRLHSIVSAFEVNRCRPLLVIHDAALMDVNGILLGSSFFEVRGRFTQNPLLNLYKNKFIGCCIAFSSDLLDLALPFPRNISMHDQWLGHLSYFAGTISYLPSALVSYRRHSNNATPLEARSSIRILINKINSFLTFLFACIRILSRHTLRIGYRHDRRD